MDFYGFERPASLMPGERFGLFEMNAEKLRAIIQQLKSDPEVQLFDQGKELPEDKKDDKELRQYQQALMALGQLTAEGGAASSAPVNTNFEKIASDSLPFMVHKTLFTMAETVASGNPTLEAILDGSAAERSDGIYIPGAVSGEVEIKDFIGNIFKNFPGKYKTQGEKIWVDEALQAYQIIVTIDKDLNGKITKAELDQINGGGDKAKKRKLVLALAVLATKLAPLKRASQVAKSDKPEEPKPEDDKEEPKTWDKWKDSIVSTGLLLVGVGIFFATKGKTPLPSLFSATSRLRHLGLLLPMGPLGTAMWGQSFLTDHMTKEMPEGGTKTVMESIISGAVNALQGLFLFKDGVAAGTLPALSGLPRLVNIGSLGLMYGGFYEMFKDLFLWMKTAGMPNIDAPVEEEGMLKSALGFVLGDSGISKVMAGIAAYFLGRSFMIGALSRFGPWGMAVGAGYLLGTKILAPLWWGEQVGPKWFDVNLSVVRKPDGIGHFVDKDGRHRMGRVDWKFTDKVYKKNEKTGEKELVGRHEKSISLKAYKDFMKSAEELKAKSEVAKSQLGLLCSPNGTTAPFSLITDAGLKVKLNDSAYPTVTGEVAYAVRLTAYKARLDETITRLKTQKDDKLAGEMEEVRKELDKKMQDDKVNETVSKYVTEVPPTPKKHGGGGGGGGGVDLGVSEW